MFRKMRRFNQQISDSECIEILKNTKRGVLSMENYLPHLITLAAHTRDFSHELAAFS